MKYGIMSFITSLVGSAMDPSDLRTFKARHMQSAYFRVSIKLRSEIGHFPTNSMISEFSSFILAKSNFLTTAFNYVSNFENRASFLAAL